MSVEVFGSATRSEIVSEAEAGTIPLTDAVFDGEAPTKTKAEHNIAMTKNRLRIFLRELLLILLRRMVDTSL